MVRKHSKKKKSPLKERIAELRAGLRKKAREYSELKDTLQRVQAEFENSMKRREKEIEMKGQKARAEVLLNFLPVLDSVEEALKHSKDGSGLKQLHLQLLQAFQKNNVSEIECSGSFNPNTMDCMIRASNPKKENNSVLEVFQKGYMLGNAVLRPARVKINVYEKEKEEVKGDKK